jgi:hypothetical protein
VRSGPIPTLIFDFTRVAAVKEVKIVRAAWDKIVGGMKRSFKHVFGSDKGETA